MCINDASENFNQQITRHILSLTTQNLPVLLVIEDSRKSGSQPWLETLNSNISRAQLLLDMPPNILPWSSLHGYPQETVDGSKDTNIFLNSLMVQYVHPNKMTLALHALQRNGLTTLGSIHTDIAP